MVLDGEAARRSGWHRQAERLALTHTAGWAGSLSGSQQTPRPIVETARPECGSEQLICKKRLSGELELESVNVVELRRQGVQETIPSRILPARIHAFAAQAIAADKRASKLACEIGIARDELAQRENENASLQTSLDLVVNENAHLSRRLSEAEATNAQAQSQLDLLNASLTEVQTDRNRLAAALARAYESQRTGASALSDRLEAMSSRAIAAEKLLAEARQGLIARNEENNSILGENSRLSRCLAEGEIAVDTAWSRVEEVRTALNAAEAERDKLAAALEAANEKYHIETDAFAIRFEAASARAIAAENQLAQAHQNLAARAEENNRVVSESLRLSQRLAENDAAVNRAVSQGGELKTELTAMKMERDRLAAELNAVTERHQTETNAFNIRFEATSTRASAAEKLLAEARHNLISRAEENASILGENSRLCDRIARNDKETNKTRSQIEELNTALMAAECERDKLGADLHNAHERRLTETDMLISRFKEMSELAAAAERAFVETKQGLADRLEQLQNALQLKAAQIVESEHARSQLVEGANALLSIFQTRTAALTWSEDRIKVLGERVQILLKLLFAHSLASSSQATPQFLKEALRLDSVFRTSL